MVSRSDLVHITTHCRQGNHHSLLSSFSLQDYCYTIKYINPIDPTGNTMATPTRIGMFFLNYQPTKTRPTRMSRYHIFPPF